MKRFSAGEDSGRVFDPLGDKAREKKIQQGNWIDLYEMLEIKPTATAFELDEKIIERGADVVFFAFSGKGKPAHISQLEKHLPDMRPVLLDQAARRNYDRQTKMHQSQDPEAVPYADFIKTLDRREYSGCMTALLPVAFFILARSIL